MADERQTPIPAEQVAGLYEQAESQAAKAGERLVGSQGFASVLGQVAENVAALTKLGNDGMDLVLRNLRVAGRRDVVRLARQLARTEDKLERVLQELEELRDELRRRDESPASRGSAKSASARQQAGNGATAPQRRRRSSGGGGGGRSTGKS